MIALNEELKKAQELVAQYKHTFKLGAVVKGSLPDWQKHMLDKAGHAVYYEQVASTYHADIDPEIKMVLAPHLTFWKQVTWMVQYKTYKAVSAIEKVLWGFNHSKAATPKAYAVATKVKKAACALINGLGISLGTK